MYVPTNFANNATGGRPRPPPSPYSVTVTLPTPSEVEAALPELQRLLARALDGDAVAARMNEWAGTLAAAAGGFAAPAVVPRGDPGTAAAPAVAALADRALRVLRDAPHRAVGLADAVELVRRLLAEPPP